MNKSIKFTIETQTEDNKVISICHVNERALALDTSEDARAMLRLNRSLFDKINSSTKIVAGSIYREEVIKEKSHTNRLMVVVNDSYDYNEKEVASLVFEKDILQPLIRAKTKRGTIIDYNRDNIKQGQQALSLDPSNPSIDDIREAKTMSRIEEISPFRKQGIRTFVLTDNLKEQESLMEVGYRASLKIETSFKDYVLRVADELNKAVLFVSKYVNDATQNYDYHRGEFSKPYSQRIFRQLQIENEYTVDLNRRNIKQSEFGQAAKTFYNASFLVNKDVDKQVYSKILTALLPTSKTNPENILNISKSFSQLYNRIQKSYPCLRENLYSSITRSRIRARKRSDNEISQRTVSKMKIEKEPLGYNIFGPRRSGMSKMDPSMFASRAKQEQAKYYPKLNVKDDTKFLAPKEKAAFMNMSQAPAFLTPSNFIMGDQTIDTSRGMMNISPDTIREFRMAKAIRSQQTSYSLFPNRATSAPINKKSLASFNLTIGPPKKTILTRTIEEKIDPLVDAKYYLGDESVFLTNNLIPKKLNFKRKEEKEDKRILSFVSDVIPNRFLQNKKSLTSIRDIQFSNPDSTVRKLVLAKKIDLEEIPPQVKFMMTKDFVANDKLDPIKNRDTRVAIKEMQTNLFEVRATVGFEKDVNGFIDLQKPIVKRLNSETLSSNEPMIAKAHSYEVPELGIVKDKFEPTIYNNLVYLKGNNNATKSNVSRRSNRTR